jgi:hypothetical protein
MFCDRCRDRPARCTRRCERLANGEHLWNTIQDNLARARGIAVAPHLTWSRQASDVQQAFIEGAQTMRERVR